VGSAFPVSQTLLSLIRAAEDALTFRLSALYCVVAWIDYRAPGTKAQLLEHIQQLWKVTR
jgi:hypothetical protein